MRSRNRFASALRLLNSHEDWLQENREAISERLELSFEQIRNGDTCIPEQPHQILAERSRTCRQQAETVLLKGTASAVPQIHSPGKGL